MNNKKDIKRFVREELKCECPDEVFESIEYEKDVDIEGLKVRDKIKIGGKLLVYVVDEDKLDYMLDEISRLLVSGKSERDESGLNRFRFVLLSDKILEMSQVLVTVQIDSGCMDDNMFVHMVSKKKAIKH
jgi:hypothetical protein